MDRFKPRKMESTAKLPVIQGGMGVGISLSSLAGAVAKEGGIGLISTTEFMGAGFLPQCPGGKSEGHGERTEKGQSYCP